MNGITLVRTTAGKDSVVVDHNLSFDEHACQRNGQEDKHLLIMKKTGVIQTAIP